MASTTSETRAEGAESGRSPSRRLWRDLPFFAIAAAVLSLDQATKALVRGGLALGESWPSDDWLIKITHVTNSGAAFGILQGQGFFLTVTAAITLAAIVFYYVFPPFEHGLMRAALGLLLGGALGNLADRLRHGAVTDFIDFPRYPAFNVADSSIVIGVCVLALLSLLEEGAARRDERAPEREPDRTEGAAS